ncbi:MAG: extracellular solute-binding protein [Chloroflexi bacterium]|nr:extracellular solute-binding protein [Chloroflexota bacterium]
MKSLWIWCVVLILALLLVAAACAPREVPGPAVAPTPAATSAGPAPSIQGKDTWQVEWDKLREAAKREGTVVIYSNIGPNVRQALSEAVKQNFGIGIEFISGRPAEFGPRILAERRAGLYTGDLLIGGAGTGLDVLKPAGVLAPLDPVIFLPEALDPKAWYAGRLLWIDTDHYILSFIASPQAPILINTDMVKPDEVKSYRDLLNPKWKGKMVMNDPSVGGAGNGFFSAVAEGLMDLNYLRELAKQEILITKDERLMAEWVARGKYPLALAVSADNTTEFIVAGAPVDLVTPAEGTYVSASTGSVLLLDKPPHPNAARLMINWLLTREGGAVMAKGMGAQSARVDVPTDFLFPTRVRKPGVKYIATDYQEYIIKKNEYLKVAREVFAASLK